MNGVSFEIHKHGWKPFKELTERSALASACLHCISTFEMTNSAQIQEHQSKETHCFGKLKPFQVQKYCCKNSSKCNNSSVKMSGDDKKR